MVIKIKKHLIDLYRFTIISLFGWSHSSAGEHYVDIVGVTGSIPVVTTIFFHWNMKRLLFVFASLVCMVMFAFYQESNQESHSIFYVAGDDVYDIVTRDGSFGSAPAFFLVENISKIKNRIRTGEYEVKKGETVASLIAKMIGGQRVTRKVTIPEGYTVKMILKKLQDNQLLFGNLPTTVPEGSLAPNTYFYHYGDSKMAILKMMQNQMRQIKTRLSKLNNTKLSFDEVLILASIIEKEGANKKELSLISSVFHNRLSIRMRMQSDPTVIYPLSDGTGRLGRQLTRKDLLLVDSPYNTYRNLGLPPTPICCPGENAIIAAMNPEKTDFLYFVATKDGRAHTFSKDYKQHLREVKKAR